MEQEKILKIIRGLNTFSPDDILMMCDVDEDKLEIVLQELTEDEIIQKVSDEKYVYLQKQKIKNEYLRLIEPKEEKINPTKSKMTFKDAAEYFLEHHVKRNCTPSTLKDYKSLIKTHLVQFFGKMSIQNIRQENIKDYIALKQKDMLSDKRIKNSVTLLGSMLSKFVEWQFLAKNPYNGILNIKCENKKETKILSADEKTELLSLAKKECPRLYLMILLTLSTGLKKGEILALQKSDFIGREILVNKTLYENKIVYHKSKAAIRKISVPENIFIEMKKLFKNKKAEDLVFDTQGRSHFTHREYLRIGIIELLQKTGVEKLSFNDLRHTYAYNSLQSGMSIDYLHKQLGDYSIQATMDRYRDFIVN